MKKKLLIRAGVGFLFGIALSVLISVLTAAGGRVHLYSDLLLERTGSVAASVLLNMLISGMYGALCMGGTVVYELEDWPLLKVSLTHYLMCLLPYVPISLLLGWNSGFVELLIVIGIMTVVYFIIWLIMFLRYRAEVRELNDINRRRAAQTNADEDPLKNTEHEGE